MIRGASTLFAALFGLAASSVSCAPGPWVPPPSEPTPAPTEATLERPAVVPVWFERDDEARPVRASRPVVHPGAARFALAMPVAPPPPQPEPDPDSGDRPEPEGPRSTVADGPTDPGWTDPSPRTQATTLRYTTAGAVSLAPEVARRIAEVADTFHRQTNKQLVLTSGTRDAARQADAMVEAMRLGADVVRLYRDKGAAREIREAFDGARAERLAPRDVVARVEATIRDQIARGTYVSAHLRAGAVDVRSRGMTAVERATFVAAARACGFSVLEETAPPHFHLQLGD